MYSIIGSKTDLHVLSLKLRNSSHYVVPSARNVDSEVCKDVDTNEHHREALRLGKTVIIHKSVCVLHTENYHSGLIEGGGGLYKIIAGDLDLTVSRLTVIHKIILGVYGKDSGTDSVVDNAALVESMVNVRTLICKNGRKKRSRGNELKLDGDIVISVGIAYEIAVNKASLYLELVTSCCEPDLESRVALLGKGHNADRVVVAEEGSKESCYLVAEGIPEISLCLGSLLAGSLNSNVVKEKRLGLRVGKEGTERTDIALETRKKSCDLILVSSHLEKKIGDLLERTNVGGLFSCESGKLLSNAPFSLVVALIVKDLSLAYHIDKNVGHDSRETVVTVGIGSRACELNNCKVIGVDIVKCILNGVDDLSHIAESDLKSYGVFNALFKVEVEGLLTVGSLCYLPIVAVVKGKSFCFLKGNAVVIAELTLFDLTFLTVYVDRAVNEHTVKHVLLEAEYDIVHTGLIDLEGVGYRLTCSLPLFSSHRVKKGSGGIVRRRERIRGILYGIYCFIGSGAGVLCLDLDASLTCGLALAESLVFLVGHNILCGRKDDLGDSKIGILTVKRDDIVALLENEGERLGVEAHRVGHRVLRPYRALEGNGTDLVVVNIQLHESQLMLVAKSGYFLGPYSGIFKGKLSFFHLTLKPLGSSLENSVNVVLALIDGVGILVEPILLYRKIARLRERHLAVDLEDSLDRVRLSLVALFYVSVVNESDRVKRSLGNTGHLPGNGTRIGSEDRFNTVKGIYFVCGISILRIDILDGVDNDRALCLFGVRILKILAVRDRVEQLQYLTRIVDRVVRAPRATAAFLFSRRSSYRKAAYREGQTKYQSHQPLKFCPFHRKSSCCFQASKGTLPRLG